MGSAEVRFRERWLGAHDGLRLYYRDYGLPSARATPVVCLTGLTRNSRDFHRLASHLSRNRRVLCPDYRGRGRSDYADDWRRYRAQAVITDVMQLLAANNLHRVVVCGTSYGGLVAMALAVAVPSALAGVVLNDIGPDLDDSGRGRILRYISRDHVMPDWSTAVAHLKATFPTLSFKTDVDWRRFAEGTYREGPDGRLCYDWDLALVTHLRRDRDQPTDFWPLFGALRRVSALALRGGLSDLLSAETLKRMIKAKPDLAHLTLPGIGHAPSLDEPDARRAIDDFLARVDG